MQAPWSERLGEQGFQNEGLCAVVASWLLHVVKHNAVPSTTAWASPLLGLIGVPSSHASTPCPSSSCCRISPGRLAPKHQYLPLCLWMFHSTSAPPGAVTGSRKTSFLDQNPHTIHLHEHTVKTTFGSYMLLRQALEHTLVSSCVLCILMYLGQTLPRDRRHRPRRRSP